MVTALFATWVAIIPTAIAASSFTVVTLSAELTVTTQSAK